MSFQKAKTALVKTQQASSISTSLRAEREDEGGIEFGESGDNDLSSESEDEIQEDNLNPPDGE